MILEGLRNFGGKGVGLNTPNPPYATVPNISLSSIMLTVLPSTVCLPSGLMCFYYLNANLYIFLTSVTTITNTLHFADNSSEYYTQKMSPDIHMPPEQNVR